VKKVAANYDIPPDLKCTGNNLYHKYSEKYRFKDDTDKLHSKVSIAMGKAFKLYCILKN